ncbi:hypothetical protein [Frankia sp. Cas3]|uniref:hypothetical protein n=1 Tax=Frankia sp. Cas3 TaxID=3073926 RepID=UPI002AD49F16|nr:hypothetical protein [Frankia sp. Cas3]
MSDTPAHRAYASTEPDGEPPAPFRMGVLLQPIGTAVLDDEQTEIGEIQPASGRRSRPRDWVVASGEAALAAVGDAIANQIGVIADRVASALDTSPVGSAQPGHLGVESVEVSLGLTFAAGTGKAIEVLLTAGGEATARISVVLTRRPV